MLYTCWGPAKGLFAVTTQKNPITPHKYLKKSGLFVTETQL